MKLYIKSAVSVDNLKSQFGSNIDNRTFNELLSLDPTTKLDSTQGGKYCPWILRQHNLGNLKPSDYTNLKDALANFAKNYRKYPYSDIGRYSTVKEFLNAAREVGNRPLTEREQAKMLKKSAHNAGDEDKKLLAKDGQWELWQPLTYAGSISLARQGGEKAEWCTAYEGDDSYWRNYTSQGPLYIFINTSNPGEKYQLHFESNSWYDFYDDDLGMDAFYEFILKHPKFMGCFHVHIVNGLAIKDDTVIRSLGHSSHITVPNGVTGIADGAFAYWLNLESVILPDSVTYIGDNAFDSCDNLTSITIPDSVTDIGIGAFASCRNLKNVTIPDSITSLENSAFYDCTKLASITIPNSITSINTTAFAHCRNLKNVTLPDSVTSIGNGAFSDCTSLTDVTIPDSVTTIADYAFSYCIRLTSITIPDSVRRIGKRAFANCKNLNSVTMRESLFDEAIFEGCSINIQFNLK